MSGLPYNSPELNPRTATPTDWALPAPGYVSDVKNRLETSVLTTAHGAGP